MYYVVFEAIWQLLTPFWKKVKCYHYPEIMRMGNSFHIMMDKTRVYYTTWQYKKAVEERVNSIFSLE